MVSWHNCLVDEGYEDSQLSSEHTNQDAVISACGVGKCYHIYARPQDRLKQMLCGRRRQYFREFCALRDVSFQIRRGQVFGIIGKNGSGKSTLLQILAGVLAPTMGEVVRHGRTAAILELGCGFNPEHSGRENAILNGQVMGMSTTEIRDRLPEIERFADIGEFFDRPLKLYSTGMYSRLAFAVCANVSADLFIIDEILSVGDVGFQRKCYKRIREIQSKGTTIILATHDPLSVRLMCDTALLLNSGQVYKAGDPSKVLDEYSALLLRDNKDTSPPSDWQLSQDFEEKQQGARGSLAKTFSAQFLSKIPKKMSFASSENKAISGDLKVEVAIAVVLGAEGEHVAAVGVGDTCTVRSLLRFHETTDHFCFGVLIRDRFGQDIFGQSASNSKLGLQGPFPPDALVAVDFRFRCELRQDTYFVTLGVGDAARSQVHYYASDVMELRLEARGDPVYGLANLPFEFRGETVSWGSTATCALINSLEPLS